MESRRIHFRSGGGLDLFFFNISRSVLIIVSLSCQILLPLLTSIVKQRVEILFGQPLAQQGTFATKAVTNIKASAHGAALYLSERGCHLTLSWDEGEGATQKLNPLRWVVNVCFTPYPFIKETQHTKTQLTEGFTRIPCVLLVLICPVSGLVSLGQT